ncbi:protein arginine N-methyltransferase 7-like [Patiria miniata]|uniref:Protein arginine N-methyltransferase n=1 Tax=Patiria miniata TaxID=46514 RepID=A0A914B477_PATMI|nr:protein arginine N-methyltransferase 7-like [Patiria miniata]
MNLTLARLLRAPSQPLASSIDTLRGHCSGPFCPSKASPMSAILSRVNPTTGTSEWVVEDSTYDYHQEIARSAYTDMLHDDERNKKYYEGIRRAIKLMHARGKKANVLDIGTGTGLLSMMAAESGADTVYACEAFEPIAKVAKNIIAKNGFAERINIIAKRSTEVTVGLEGDMPHKGNILPAEVFDTELIGEGAVPTYLHAHRHLLEKDSICIPHSATVWAQVIQSGLVWNWHKLQPIQIAGRDDVIRPLAKMAACSGAASVHDVQLSQVSPDQFRPITAPLDMIEFNFSTGDFAERRAATVETAAESDGMCHGVFMWWDLSMDTEGEIRLSTAPTWAHPEGLDAQWRDHWMQAVYFLDQPLQVRKGEPLHVTLSHDDYSLWFNVSQSPKPNVEPERPVCHCGAHVAWSRPRIGMLNDAARTETFTQALRKVVNDKTLCVSVSDGSMLPLIAARLGAKQVYSLEPNFMTHRVMQDIIKGNNLTEEVILSDESALNLPQDFFKGQKIDVLMGEPFFLTSILPWHNLHFWYARTALSPHMAEGALVLPSRARLRGVAAEFDHLWKFHAPVGNIEGFDVRTFDGLVQSSSAISDAPTEPHHLWEYPGQALSQDFNLMEFDFCQPVPTDTQTQSGTAEILGQGTCHGVALWMEYQLDQDTWVSTGLQRPVPPTPIRDLAWDRHSKQGVYFIKTNPRVAPGSRMQFDVSFNPSHGSVHFKFEVV